MKDGRQYGPVVEGELRRLALQGGIAPGDWVWKAGLGPKWMPASSIGGLFAAPPPLPPPVARQAEVRGTPKPITPGGPPASTNEASAFRKMVRRFFAPVSAAAIVAFKYLGELKFLLPVLKTGSTMILSIAAYAMAWGWLFAVGFVLLLFVHECGHLVAAKKCGLKVGAPIFIPFMGALIALKDAPRNAWIESQVGIGGPLLGTVGAAACEVVYLLTGNALFRALAYTGFFLNLFNLLPVGVLDGGRIVSSLSPWIWLLGFVILVGLIFLHFNFLLLVILAISLPRLFSLFKKKTEQELRYFEVTPSQRFIMATLYFGLIAFLVVGMQMTHLHVNLRSMNGSPGPMQHFGSSGH